MGTTTPGPRARVRRVILRAAAAATLVAVAAVAWALLWPAPRAALRCAPGDGEGCVAASGRVLWVPRSDRRDRREALHLLLLSRDSVAAPGITLVKIDPGMRPPRTPSPGRWVSVVGVPHVGSNGFDDIGVSRYVLSP